MAYIGQTPTSSPPDFSSSDSSSSTLLDTSSSPPCDPGCLCGPYYSFIVFANLSVPSPAPRYYIGTTWRVFYPFQVKQSLNHVGFQVLDSGYPSCGYTLEDTTSARGIVRGWYGINGSGSQPDGQSDIGVQVDDILRSTYPYVEIYLLASILLFPVLLLSVIVSTSFLSLSLCASDQKTNRKQNTSTIKGLGARFSRWTRFSRWRSKPSPHIAKLPAELQLHIMSYLDYRSAVNLRHTSRYYSQIISLADISTLRTRDGESNAPGTDQGLRSCVRCLSLLPSYGFDTDQLGSGVSNQQRQCLQCSLRGGGYSHGGIVRGQLFCAHCRTLKNASNEKVPDSSWQWKLNDLEPAWRWCRECLDCRSRLIAANLLIRLPQFAIALVIFGLANSGLMPAQLWSWIWLAALFWATIYYIVGATFYRGIAQSTRVSAEPMVFGLVIALAWAGVAIRLTYEATKPAQSLLIPYDAHYKALMVFCYLEAVLFILDFLFITAGLQLLWFSRWMRFH